MKNKALIFVSIVSISLGGWYFLIKKSDYVVTFKAKAATGTVYQGIIDWANDQEKKNNQKFTIIASNQFTSLVQETQFLNKIVRYDWDITPVNDSITAVSVGISGPENKISNRFSALFGSEFVNDQISKIKTFKNGLDDHLATFKVGKVSEGESKSQFVAYITLESVLQEKAQTMIGNDNIITGYLFKNKINILGKPILEVEKLDLQTEKIKFNYCFPISENTKYIADQNVKFKTISAKKGLKIDYYGNYRTSDRGWFKILDYAKKNNIDLDLNLTEHYLNNPFSGGKEIEWKTEIVIPFQK